MAKRLKQMIAIAIADHTHEGPSHLPKYISCMKTIKGPNHNDFYICYQNKFPEKHLPNQKLNVNKNITKIREESIENNEICEIYKVNPNHFIKSVIEEIVFDNFELPETIPKTKVIDFSSPNIAKPFHMGHLRSTIIGNFITNINLHLGDNVTKLNYLGDWGTQFGILKVGLDLQGLQLSDIEKDPINTLYQCYVTTNKKLQSDPTLSEKAREYFTNIESGKVDDVDLWREIRKFTVVELTKVYQRLGVTFDIYNWESDYNYNHIKNTILLLEEKGILEKDLSGKKVVKVEEKSVAVIKSDGSTLYLARDIAALIDRYERYKFDEMLYVVENGQHSHFKALFDVWRQLNAECADRCKHVKFGRIHGMSTRRGTAVFLSDILDEAKYKMHKKQLDSPNTRRSAQNEDVCDVLGTTAVIVNDLKYRRQRDYEFNWDKVLQSEGDSGVKLQYLHCRLWSMEHRSGAKLPTECDPECFLEKEALSLIAELAKFDEVVSRARDEMESSTLLNYLFRLTSRINGAIKVLRVKNEEQHLASQRLLLFHAARLTLKKGLQILGIKPLNQM